MNTTACRGSAHVTLVGRSNGPLPTSSEAVLLRHAYPRTATALCIVPSSFDGEGYREQKSSLVRVVPAASTQKPLQTSALCATPPPSIPYRTFVCLWDPLRLQEGSPPSPHRLLLYPVAMVSACRGVSSLASAAAAAGAAATVLLVTSSLAPAAALDLSPAVAADAIADAVLGRMDRTVDPCVDAVRWACGGWMDKAVIKPSQTRAGPYFTDVRERVVAGLDRVLSSAEEAGTPAGTLYTACMRAVNATDGGTAATAAGMAMLRRFAPSLAAISTNGSMEAVVDALATLHSNGGGTPLVDWGVSNSRVKFPEMVLKAYLPRLGMSRTGFRAEDPIARDINAAYRRMLSELATIAGKAGLFPIGPDAQGAGGWPTAADAAAAVYAFEERIEEWQTAGYNAWRRATDQPRYNFLEVATHPDITLIANLLAAWGVTPPAGKVIVKFPVYFREASTWLASSVVADAAGDGRRTLRAYLAVTATRSLAAADVLGPDAAVAYWRYRQEVKGTAAPPRATNRCVKRVGDLLPWGVGDAFVRHFFVGANKLQAATDLVDAIRGAYPSLFDGAAWLDAQTRAAAKAKFIALTHNVVNFPRNPTDHYDDVVVAVDDYSGSWLSAARHAWRVDWARLNSPRAEREPHMASWETNAQYSSRYEEGEAMGGGGGGALVRREEAF